MRVGYFGRINLMRPVMLGHLRDNVFSERF